MGRVSSAHLIALALALVVTAVQAEPTDIYRRAELIETRTGVVDVRTVFGPRLNVPKDCDDGSEGCTEEIVFPRLYTLEFALETRSLVDGNPQIERQDRGQVFLALYFNADDQELFDDELRAYLASLGADVFEENYARLPHSRAIQRTPEKSITPSWACFREDDRLQVTKYSREVRENPDGEEGAYHSSFSSWGGRDSDEPFCEEMVSATRDAFPDEIRTQPVPRKVEELTVRLVERNTIREEAYVEELTRMPEGSSFTRKKLVNGSNSSSASRSKDGSARSARSEENVAWTTAVVEANIPPGAVQQNAWLTRWELDTVERTFGPAPADQYVAGSRLSMALLPTLPPVELDKNNEPIPLDVPIETVSPELDVDAFLAEVGKRLDQQTELDIGSLESALIYRPEGLGTEGWLLVICRPDGSGYYGIPPDTHLVRLLNADLFCAAVEAELD